VGELAWSPDGRYVCTVPQDADAVRVWETRRWRMTRCAETTAGVTSVCWHRDSRHILFSVKGDATVYVLRMTPPELANAVESPYAGLESVLLEPYFVAEFDAACADSSGHARVGGVVRSMALDPNGERLVVAFEDSVLLAVFIVRLGAWVGERQPLLPSGFLRGPVPGARPTAVHFARQFDRGSLLSICWANGKVTFVPFYYRASTR